MPLAAYAATVQSPDGRLVLTTAVEGGRPVYSVAYDGKIILENSPLGFTANIGNFQSGISSVAEKTGKVALSFDQDKIKKSHIDWNANTLTEEFQNAKGQKFSIEWQVGDNDLAFRYLIPVQGDTRSMIIEKEASGYRFPTSPLPS